MSEKTTLKNGASAQARIVKINYGPKIYEHITTVVHTLTIGFVILIICLCFVEEFSFSAWHALLLSIGWVCLMGEGILAVQKDNVFSGGFVHKNRVLLHWIAQVLALSLTAAGFAFEVVSKDRGGRGHFTTWHGIFGLVGIVFSFLAGLNGFPALFNVNLRNYVRPNVNKLFHACCGILAFTFGGVAILFLFQYSNHWFAGRTNDNQPLRFFCFYSVLFCIIWTLIAPLLTAYERFKSIF